MAAGRAVPQADRSMRGSMLTYRRFMASRSRCLGIAVLLWLAGVQMATAAELLMFESAGCPYCRAWDREIGAIYPLSDLAAAAPLRRVGIDAERPSDLAGIDAIVFTPTFVLFDEGREVGRITGYIGEYQFWGLLDGMVRSMPRSDQSVAEGH